MPPRSSWPALVVIVALVWRPSDARAEDPLARPSSSAAAERLALGVDAYKRGDYQRAIAEYEAGARIEDVPAWDWNLGLAHQRAGNLERARWYFERLIRRIEGKPDADDVIAAARLHLNEIDAAHAKRDEDVVDQPEPSSAHGERTLWTTQRKIAVGVGALGVIAIGVGAGLGSSAESLKHDAATACPPGCSTMDAEVANRLIARADDRARGANGAFVAGGLAVVGSVVLWLTGAPTDEVQTATAVVPSVTPAFTGVTVARRF